MDIGLLCKSGLIKLVICLGSLELCPEQERNLGPMQVFSESLNCSAVRINDQLTDISFGASFLYVQWLITSLALWYFFEMKFSAIQ